jgi:hypothetical protein
MEIVSRVQDRWDLGPVEGTLYYPFFSDSFSVKGCCFSEPYTILKIFSFSPNPFPPCILTFPDLSGASHPHGTAVELSSTLAGQVEISFQRGRSDHFDHVTLKAASPVLGTLA